MSGIRRLPPWPLVAAAALYAAVVAALAVGVGGWAADDFFITYRYAANLAAGHGLVFDPGERVFGTTAPGLALLLGGLAAVTGAPVPRLGTAVTAASLWIVAVLLLAAGRRHGRAAEGFAAGLLVTAAPFLWVHVGGEAPLVLALLLAAAAVSRRRPAAAGGLAGLAAWCRPDALAGVAVLGLLLLAGRRRLPVAYGAAAGATVAAGLLAARWWFGAWLPATLEAKRLQAAVAPEVWVSGVEVWGAAVRAVRDSHAGAATPWLLALGVGGLPLLVRRGGRVGKLLVLHALALLVAYPLLGVGFYPWYASPWVVACTGGAAWAAGEAARLLARVSGRKTGAAPAAAPPGGRRTSRARPVLAVLLGAALLAPLLVAEGRRAAWLLSSAAVDPRYEAYRRAGAWIRDSTPPRAELATFEVGTLGYFARRPVRDLLGLVTPESLPHVARRDLAGAFFAAPPPELFVLWEPLAPFAAPLLGDPRFAAGWRPAARVRGRAGWPEVVIYRREDEAAGGASASGAEGAAAAAGSEAGSAAEAPAEKSRRISPGPDS